MFTQSAFITADIRVCLQRVLSIAQPLRLRGLPMFARLVDTAAPSLTSPSIHALTPAILGRKAIRVNGTTPTFSTKPQCLLAAKRQSTCSCNGAFRVAAATATTKSTSIVPGKFLSPLGVLRGRITVGFGPRYPVFIMRNATSFLVQSAAERFYFFRALAFVLARARCESGGCRYPDSSSS